MDFCALLIVIGLSSMCPAPPPPPPDLAAIELQGIREDMKRQERQADEKLDRLYGTRKPTQSGETDGSR